MSTLEDYIADPVNDFDTFDSDNERERLVEVALSGVKNPLGRQILQSFINEENLLTIAKNLNLSYDAARSKLNVARRQAAKSLIKNGYEPFGGK